MLLAYYPLLPSNQPVFLNKYRYQLITSVFKIHTNSPKSKHKSFRRLGEPYQCHEKKA